MVNQNIHYLARMSVDGTQFDLSPGGYCAGDDAPAVAVRGFYPSEVEPYLFYKCQNADGCAGGGGGVTGRTISNQRWFNVHVNSTMTALPTAAGALSEPARCDTGMIDKRNFLHRRQKSRELTYPILTGYTGFLCSKCQLGYYMLQGQCSLCPNDVRVRTSLLLFSVVHTLAPHWLLNCVLL